MWIILIMLLKVFLFPTGLSEFLFYFYFFCILRVKNSMYLPLEKKTIGRQALIWLMSSHISLRLVHLSILSTWDVIGPQRTWAGWMTIYRKLESGASPFGEITDVQARRKTETQWLLLGKYNSFMHSFSKCSPFRLAAQSPASWSFQSRRGDRP